MKKKLLVATALALPTLGLAGSAMAMSNNGQGMQENIAENLATRFSLNKDEVSAFMSEKREARHAEMQSKVAEALRSAGFSDEQVTVLQTKKQEQRDEMKTWRTANPDASSEERKTHREAEKTEFEAWQKNKILISRRCVLHSRTPA